MQGLTRRLPRILVPGLALACLTLSAAPQPRRIETNAVIVHDAPAWLTERMVRTVARTMENTLEWDIRRVNAYWHPTMETFLRAQSLGGEILAATNRKSQVIHIGPKVTEKNFASVFGHELAHVIVIQKYKQAIPLWLEEGLANHAAKIDAVDYDYLNSRPYQNVETLTHPFGDGRDAKYHYHASTALMQMIASKCPIRDLLQLSVGKTIETYLATFCQIKDLNDSFRAWLASKRK